MNYSHKYFENHDCKYYPCHKGIEEINCLFCYCPMYAYSNCPGNPTYKDKDGKKIKVCTGCSYPHKEEHYDMIMQFLRENK